MFYTIIFVKYNLKETDHDTVTKTLTWCVAHCSLEERKLGLTIRVQQEFQSEYFLSVYTKPMPAFSYGIYLILSKARGE